MQKHSFGSYHYKLKIDNFVIDHYLFITWYIKIAIQDLTILVVSKHDDEDDEHQDNDEEEGNNDSNHVQRLIDAVLWLNVKWAGSSIKSIPELYEFR